MLGSPSPLFPVQPLTVGLLDMHLYCTGSIAYSFFVDFIARSFTQDRRHEAITQVSGATGPIWPRQSSVFECLDPAFIPNDKQ